MFKCGYGFIFYCSFSLLKVIVTKSNKMCEECLLGL